MAKINTHPDNQQLIRCLRNPDAAEYQQIKSHLEDCPECMTTFQDLQTVSDGLFGIHEPGVRQVHAPHLDDEQIITYVNEQCTPETRASIEQHLAGCGECMKDILRYRAHLHEYSAGSKTAHVPNNASDGASVTPIDQYTKNRLLTKISVPVSLAATLIISAALVYVFHVEKPPMQIVSQANPVTSGTRDFPSVTTVPQQNKDILAVKMSTSTANQPGVNWYSGYIEASAIGTADMSKMKNKVQAESVAEKTARHLAYAQLAESLKGIQVTSTTTYEDLLLKVDNLNLQSEGFIRNARVVDKRITWVDNAPKAEVTVRAPLFGQTGLSTLLETGIPDPVFKELLLRTNLITTSHSSHKNEFSNIILDARKTGFSPALFTSLISNRQQRILTEEQSRNLQFMYYSDLQSATSSRFAGASPLIIKARPGTSAGILELDEPDALNAYTLLNRDDKSHTTPLLVVY